jgi:hypothetical protein
MQNIDDEAISSANLLIDEQIDFHNHGKEILLDKSDINVRMAAALDSIWSIGIGYDGYENSLEGLRALIDEFVALSLATEYWKVLK